MDQITTDGFMVGTIKGKLASSSNSVGPTMLQQGKRGSALHMEGAGSSGYTGTTLAFNGEYSLEHTCLRPQTRENPAKCPEGLTTFPSVQKNITILVSAFLPNFATFFHFLPFISSFILIGRL